MLKIVQTRKRSSRVLITVCVDLEGSRGPGSGSLGVAQSLLTFKMKGSPRSEL